PLDHKKLATLRERALQQAKEMGRYVDTTDRCRTQLLLEYFGELSDKSCRICDYCLAQRKKERTAQESATLHTRILELLHQKPLLPKELVAQFEPKHHALTTNLLRELVELGKLKYRENGTLELAS